MQTLFVMQDVLLEKKVLTESALGRNPGKLCSGLPAACVAAQVRLPRVVPGVHLLPLQLPIPVATAG